jgi:hypothetical protein
MSVRAKCVANTPQPGTDGVSDIAIELVPHVFRMAVSFCDCPSVAA